MNHRMKQFVKFLFPEWQIVEAIRKHGLIAWPKRNRPSPARQASTAQGGWQPAAAGPIPAAPSGSQASQPSAPAFDGRDIAAAYAPQHSKAADPNSAAAAFADIRSELGRLMVGQGPFLDQLALAFQRPFATGQDAKPKPKNVIVVLGHKGTGKRAGVEHMARAMHARKLARSPEIAAMDLSLYPAASDQALFLSDLYKALYGPSDIVLFEHLESCHPGLLEILVQLSAEGTYTLRSRYVIQSGNLIEATGVLTQQTISEIGANGKYLVFASTRSEKAVWDALGPKAMNAAGDVVRTDRFTEQELYELGRRMLERVRHDCRHKLSVLLTWNEEAVRLLASAGAKDAGVDGMERFAETEIFKPLAEYVLRRGTAQGQEAAVSVESGTLTANIGETIVTLREYMPKRAGYDLEDVKQELDGIVGIPSVKNYVLGLEEHLRAQQRRKEAGLATTGVSMHMIFTGNPGTGKTTIARIAAKYLKALGVLSTGQLREVTRADLVGQYVGHTAKQTNEVIQSALGGVLFIDEAYALCRDKHDAFGLEAIDALVKAMEDHRDDLVVILAGYREEMEAFLNVNSGLKSRFPNVIDFEDYAPEEMYEISLITAKTKGYRIPPDCKEPLIRLYEKKQIKGRNDGGNGRLVRNVIEAAILRQSKRLAADPAAEIDVLAYDDFPFDSNEPFDLEASLAQIVGLDNVKEFVRTQHKLLIAQEKRRAAGLAVDASQSLNMIFAGNPGTGKTTVARVVASMFKEMGVLKSGQLIETDRGGLVAEYVGHTAKKTEEVFKSALGGVLFIDEAYALTADGGSFGMEAVNALVKLIEDHRGEIVVILAGYTDEMAEFLKANSGLASRFPLKLEFPDYSAQELHQIALKLISSKGFALGDGAEPILQEQIAALHRRSDAHSGNGRMVRNYVEEITRNQSARIATTQVSVEDMNVMMPEDIERKQEAADAFDVEQELAGIVGLNEVKDFVRGLHAKLRLQKERKRLGLTADGAQTLHMIFKGNPGTGKTMVARTVAKVLHQAGVLSTGKLTETDRSGLVAGYVGQTALKTRELFMEALDGVLFIDEAYALSQGGANDFGKEAIDTLVKLMDDYRDRIIVILAGYDDDMERFLNANPGLRSRFPNIIAFADYAADELMRISEQLFAGRGYELSGSAKEKLFAVLESARLEPNFGNGRYVRNLYDKALMNQAMRLSTDTDLTREELVTIIDSDIQRV